MADSDSPAPDEPVSALRRRTAKARAARAARLAANLRANIGRRKQQARDRLAGETRDDPDDGPAS